MKDKYFSNFSCMFLNSKTFSNLYSNFSNSLDLRNLQEQVKKAFCYQKLFWPFTAVQIVLVISFLQILGIRPRFSKVSLDQYNNFYLTVGQNNFGNKIPKTKQFFFKIIYIFFQISRRLHVLSYYSFLFKHCLIGNSICLFLMTGILNKKWTKSRNLSTFI